MTLGWKNGVEAEWEVSMNRSKTKGNKERTERHRKSFGGEMSVVVIFHTGKRYDFVGSAQLKVETQNEEVW